MRKQQKNISWTRNKMVINNSTKSMIYFPFFHCFGIFLLADVILCHLAVKGCESETWKNFINKIVSECKSQRWNFLEIFEFSFRKIKNKYFYEKYFSYMIFTRSLSIAVFIHQGVLAHEGIIGAGKIDGEA